MSAITSDAALVDSFHAAGMAQGVEWFQSTTYLGWRASKSYDLAILVADGIDAGWLDPEQHSFDVLWSESRLFRTEHERIHETLKALPESARPTGDLGELAFDIQQALDRGRVLSIDVDSWQAVR